MSCQTQYYKIPIYHFCRFVSSITHTKKEAGARKVSPDRSFEMTDKPEKEPAAKGSAAEKGSDAAPELEPWTVNVRGNAGKATDSSQKMNA